MNPELVPSDKVKEIVLANGQFASFYKVRAIHVAKSMNTNPYVQMSLLLAQCCTIDDKRREPSYFLGLEMPIFKQLIAQFED